MITIYVILNTIDTNQLRYRMVG